MLRISLIAALAIGVALPAPAHATFFWPQRLSPEECARRAEEGRQAPAFLDQLVPAAIKVVMTPGGRLTQDIRVIR